VRGEPIVCSPEDSYKCFMRTEMDVLAIEDFILYKDEQANFSDKEDWQKIYELD
jgi:carbamoyltransferase